MDRDLYSGKYLIPGEDPEEFAALCEDYRRKFGPACAVTEFCVDDLIYTEWRMRRYRKVEKALIEHYSKQAKSPYPSELHEKPFRRVREHLSSLTRSYQASLSMLQKLQKPTRQTTDAKGKTKKSGSFRQNTHGDAKPYLVTPPPPKTRPN